MRRFILNIDDIKGDLIRSGSEKECYVNKFDNTRCLKLGRESSCKQIKREIAYFKYMIKCGKDKATFVPHFYSEFKTKDFIGYEQECFLDKNKGGIYDRAWPLWMWLRNSSVDRSIIIEELKQLKAEMIRYNIICNDLHEGNIFRVEKNSKVRLVIIDGFGPSELIPLCQYINFFGRKKIERQWNKFQIRMNNLFFKM